MITTGTIGLSMLSLSSCMHFWLQSSACAHPPSLTHAHAHPRTHTLSLSLTHRPSAWGRAHEFSVHEPNRYPFGAVGMVTALLGAADPDGETRVLMLSHPACADEVAGVLEEAAKGSARVVRRTRDFVRVGVSGAASHSLLRCILRPVIEIPKQVRFCSRLCDSAHVRGGSFLFVLFV